MSTENRRRSLELRRIAESLRSLPEEIQANHRLDLRDMFFTKAGRLLAAAIQLGAFNDDKQLLDIFEQQKEGEFGPFFWAAIKKWLVEYRRHLFTVPVLGPTVSVFRRACQIIGDLIDEETALVLTKDTDANKPIREKVGEPSLGRTAHPPPPTTAELSTHSEDFTSVNWFGRKYQFAKGQQVQAIKALWCEWEKGGHSLSEKTIGEKVESTSDSFRLTHVFRNRSGKGMHPAWGTMIVSAQKGTYKLNPPGDQESRNNHGKITT